MAKRWRLHEASSLADVGCGLCHWSRLLYPYLRQPARFAGIDREEHWILEGGTRFRRAFPEAASDLLTFSVADANKIPLPANSFEVVTCQTLLMHLEQPAEALREMVRVVRPGGVLICVEPNNLWNYMAFTSLTASEPVELLTRRFEFWLRYHRGKKVEGRGDHSIGDLLPGLFQEAGLEEIRVHLSDRAASLYPPYDSPAQQTTTKQERVWRESGKGPWDPAEVRRQVMRGGGTEELFNSVFPELGLKFDQEQQAIKAGKFHAAFGGLFYLVSGRKRA